MEAAEAVSDQAGQGRVRTHKRGHVRVFGKWCKGCGLCIAFCPQNALDAGDDHRPVVAHPERCIGCEWCEIHCPDFAIEVEPYEGATDGPTNGR